MTISGYAAMNLATLVKSGHEHSVDTCPTMAEYLSVVVRKVLTRLASAAQPTANSIVQNIGKLDGLKKVSDSIKEITRVNSSLSSHKRSYPENTTTVESFKRLRTELGHIPRVKTYTRTDFTTVEPRGGWAVASLIVSVSAPWSQ